VSGPGGRARGVARVDPRAPCIIGVGQRTQRDGSSPEPLDMWADVCHAAATDTRVADAGRVLGAADSLQIVYCQSWPYDDPARRLADRLGINPRHRLYSGIGGTTPQVLVQDAAAAVMRGECDVAVITGAEALETRRQLKRRGERPAWSFRDPERKPFPFEAPFHPAEVAHEVFQAWLTFAVWDIARRAHLSVGPDESRRRLGELMAPMTEVAAANEHAWFRQPRSPAELITPTRENRMVGYPYTKYMVSIMDVDMAAAVIVASEAAADALGVPRGRRVYLRGWCYATDPVYVAEHDEMWRSPAMASASAEALRRAGVGIDDVAHLDLYSCFASSVNFARDALGMRDDDGRAVTVTGGLPFAGGAGSDYMMHSIATMTDVLREDEGAIGLVSGVGMHMTKHVFGVYSTTPGEVSLPTLPTKARTRPIRDTYSGPATVAAYTVAHGRDGEAEWGVAVCDLPGGSGERAYARIDDPALMAEAEATELVGANVDLVAGDGNVNRLKR
jgi:acetyl-CoA C-acetyltransferase